MSLWHFYRSKMFLLLLFPLPLPLPYPLYHLAPPQSSPLIWRKRNWLSCFCFRIYRLCRDSPQINLVQSCHFSRYTWYKIDGRAVGCLFTIKCAVQFSSVAQSCLTLCDPVNCSMPGFPVHHQLLEFTQNHVHQVGDAIQPSHPLSSPSPALNPSQHQSLFQWVNSSHEVAKVLEFQLQHHSFQRTLRTDLL